MSDIPHGLPWCRCNRPISNGYGRCQICYYVMDEQAVTRSKQPPKAKQPSSTESETAVRLLPGVVRFVAKPMETAPQDGRRLSLFVGGVWVEGYWGFDPNEDDPDEKQWMLSLRRSRVVDGILTPYEPNAWAELSELVPRPADSPSSFEEIECPSKRGNGMGFMRHPDDCDVCSAVRLSLHPTKKTTP